MGTEVLRPHDCLIDRIGVPPATVIPHRRTFHNNNRYNGHLAKPRRGKPAPARSDEKKQISRRYSSDDLRQSKSHQSHNRKHNRENHPKPRAAMAPNQIWIGNRSRSLSPKHAADMYAGSAISVSPSPESLPLPSFSRNKRQVIPVIVDDSASATRDLRRLLRLD